MRLLSSLGAAQAAGLLLAACTGPVSDPPEAPGGLMGVRTRLAGPPAAAVEVLVFDVPPGRRVEGVALVDPQGRRHAAESLVPLTVETGPGVSRPTIGFGVTGGSASGVHPWIGLDWAILGGAGPARDSRRVLARVPIPDPAAYRAQATRWRVEIAVVELTGEARTLSFPAQAP